MSYQGGASIAIRSGLEVFIPAHRAGFLWTSHANSKESCTGVTFVSCLLASQLQHNNSPSSRSFAQVSSQFQTCEQERGVLPGGSLQNALLLPRWVVAVWESLGGFR